MRSNQLKSHKLPNNSAPRAKAAPERGPCQAEDTKRTQKCRRTRSATTGPAEWKDGILLVDLGSFFRLSLCSKLAKDLEQAAIPKMIPIAGCGPRFRPG